MDAPLSRKPSLVSACDGRTPDSVEMLQEVDVPALVLWGDEDGMSPLSEQNIMLEALPDAHASEIPNSGHLCHRTARTWVVRSRIS